LGNDANYLEAVGVMAALRAGVSLGSVRRPLGTTKVVCEGVEEVGEFLIKVGCLLRNNWQNSSNSGPIGQKSGGFRKKNSGARK
jgi:hypothetical protein